MSSLPEFERHFRAAAVLLLAVLAAGCGRPLSVQQEFFSPMNAVADRIGKQTRHAVSHHRALQAVQHACDTPSSASIRPGANHSSSGPNPGTTTAHEALADLCDTPARPPVAAYGAGSKAYQRWVDGETRQLPAASETAAGAAGGS